MSKAKKVAAYALAALAVVLFAVAIAVKAHQKIVIPYSDRFAANHADEWTVYGGSWRLKDGAVVNRSDERGAKVVTGEADWSNYSISAEMMMLGHGGDVGMMVRVSNAEKGINAYRGYYVGIRSQDQALVMGVADHDWIEARPVPVQGGIRHRVWYRLQVFAVDCEIAAHLENLDTHQHTWAAINSAPCFSTGKVGLRSLNTGAVYRNVRVTRAESADLARLAPQLPHPGGEWYPVREADYARMRQSYYEHPEMILDSLLGPAGNAEKQPSLDAPKLESVHSLAMTHRAETVRIHGVVTLTDPVYVQDGSGGIRVQLESPNTLNTGDEVELVGRVQQGRGAPFEASSYRVLWESNLVTPASISSTQAAGGAFDGSLIELSGVLRSWKESKDGTLALELEDIAQHFTVKVPQGLSDAAPTWWQIGSTVRVRGVCSSSAQDSSKSAFLVLLRDANDVEFLSSPPWNQGIRLVLSIASGVLALFLWVAAYLRGERRRMRAVLVERELLAGEMHDTLAQSFAGVGFHLQSIRKGLQLHGGVPDNLMRKVDVACSMAVTAHREASERIASLRHRRQKEGDLLDQLHQSAVSMLNGGHIGIHLERSGMPVRLSHDVEDALLGIGEEAIANILRHSQAREMRLALDFGLRAVELCITDDGVGFDRAATQFGVGQKGMELRAGQVGGVLEIASTPGHGSKVSVCAPYHGWARLLVRLRALKQQRGRRSVE